MRSSFVFLVLIAGLVSCRDQAYGPVEPRADAGGSVDTCNTTADCGGRGVCMAGVCEAVTTCTADDECTSLGKVCHSIRGYCVECDGRHAGECEAGETCQFDFTCVALGGADAGTNTTCTGTCNDRSECASDMVCKNNACCPPPSRCTSPNDCPLDRPDCNGATGQCFGSSGCNVDQDCASQPGCANDACACQITGAPPGVCVPRQNECASDADCLDNGVYVGEFCTLDVTPTRCQPAPGCNSDAQCVPYNLVCDLMPGSPSLNKCKNGTPCPNGTECNPTTEICGPNGVCIRKNCLNTPSVCTGTETCDPLTGQCVPMSMGSCTSDAMCNAGYYCNLLTNPGVCTVGCRDSTDCGGGICDANHQCQAAMGGVCGACVADTDCPANTRCIEELGLCYESCSSIAMIPCTMNPMAMCVFGNCSCLF